MDNSYNDNSDTQRATTLEVMEKVKDIINSNFNGRKLTVADFGVATGCNTDIVLSRVFPNLEEITLIGVDYQSDYNWSLFKKNMEKMKIGKFLFVNADFNQTKVAENGQLDFCSSFWSLFWLPLGDKTNKKPLACYCNQDDETWKSIAIDNFESFLNLRSDELRPGGMAIFQQVCSNGSQDRFFSTFGDVKQSLYKDGLINEEQRAGLFMPVYLRTVEDIEAAIQSNGSFETLYSNVDNLTLLMSKSQVKAILRPTIVTALNNTDIENVFWNRFPNHSYSDLIIHVCVLRKK